MNKSFAGLMTSLLFISAHSHAASPYFSLKDGDGFKRFSVSAGWLHAMPQGKANPVRINTPIAEGTQSKVGDVSTDSVLNAIDQSTVSGKAWYTLLNSGYKGLLGGNTLPAALSGTATINGLSQWEAPNSGLEADDVDTLGLLFNYNFTDNLSLEIKGGIPPKVDILGKGTIYAPLSGAATPLKDGSLLGDALGNIIDEAGGNIPLKQDIKITDLSQGKRASSVRAWLPAAELQYQFGKSGVNKFRPYVGVGVMYAYFNDIKLNLGIESDLITAGNMIRNIQDNKAGAALDKKTSSANPVVKVDAADAFAPIATVGATYDFNDSWFAVGSVSYAKLNSEAKITVTDGNTGAELINSKTKIDIDPIITYVGVGYRF
ncbi:OmpW/AlkL family protein [Acinetobacter soli]|uniref:OmpW/AlkL family protein n=1 Tax=Acinetobacter soli TaxID=487316 RepID=UPI0012502E06|nr:OmpW family outer membrane protein [Acinetobacter soli]